MHSISSKKRPTSPVHYHNNTPADYSYRQFQHCIGISSPVVKTDGFWTEEEKATSMNVRELKAVFFALKLHATRFRGSTIKIFTDNTTSLKYTTKSGGTASFLQDLAVEIQDICNQATYEHVAGLENISADQLSRMKKSLYEQTIPRRMFQDIQQKWGPLKIDAFAASHNNQLKKHWILRPDPLAHA